MVLTALIAGLLLVGLCIPGFLLEKSGKFPPAVNKVLAVILTYVAQPAISLYSFQTNEYRDGILVEMGLVALFSLVSILLSALVGRVLFKKAFKKGIDEKERIVNRTLCMSTIFCNCGFMGLPFVKMLMPNNPEALLYTAIYMIFYNMLSWSLGIYILTGEKKYIKVKQILLNPPTIVMVVALPLFFLGIKLPEPLYSFVLHCQNLAAPISMLLMGVYLARMSFKTIFGDKKAYFATFIKLIIAPIIMFIVAYPFKGLLGAQAVTVILTCVVVACMPSATFNMYINDMYGTEDGSKAAVKVVLMSTILSILSAPLMLWLLNFVMPVL